MTDITTLGFAASIALAIFFAGMALTPKCDVPDLGRLQLIFRPARVLFFLAGALGIAHAVAVVTYPNPIA